jgi:hypothetical protein
MLFSANSVAWNHTASHNVDHIKQGKRVTMRSSLCIRHWITTSTLLALVSSKGNIHPIRPCWSHWSRHVSCVQGGTLWDNIGRAIGHMHGATSLDGMSVRASCYIGKRGSYEMKGETKWCACLCIQAQQTVYIADQQQQTERYKIVLIYKFNHELVLIDYQSALSAIDSQPDGQRHSLRTLLTDLLRYRLHRWFFQSKGQVDRRSHRHRPGKFISDASSVAGSPYGFPWYWKWDHRWESFPFSRLTYEYRSCL